MLSNAIKSLQIGEQRVLQEKNKTTHLKRTEAPALMILFSLVSNRRPERNLPGQRLRSEHDPQSSLQVRAWTRLSSLLQIKQDTAER